MLRFKAWLFVLLLIGLIALYVLEFRWFDRTIGMRRLALYGMSVGALLGAALARHFNRQAGNTLEKVQLYLFFVVFCTLFAPFFASVSNRLLSFSPPRAKTVEFFEEQAFFSDRFGLIEGEKVPPAGYYTFFYYQGQLRRVKSRYPLLPEKKRGQPAELMMKNGLWGYEVVVD